MDPKAMRERVRNRLAQSGRWYDIRNAEDGPAVVRIYDEIGFWGTTAEDFARDLATVTAGEIEVQISSPGGDVFDGVAIFNALRVHPARVTTRVDGVAASVASVIAQAGDHRVMLSGAQMMIHEAWGIAIGPAAEMREYADLLDRQNDNIATIYAAASGGSAEDFKALMAGGDKWLSAAEAVELGLADEVVEPERKSKAGAAVTVKAEVDDAVLAEFRALTERAEAAVAALNTQTSPAGEREELIEAQMAEVDRDEAERLLALFAPTKEEA